MPRLNLTWRDKKEKRSVYKVPRLVSITLDLKKVKYLAHQTSAFRVSEENTFLDVKYNEVVLVSPAASRKLHLCWMSLMNRPPVVPTVLAFAHWAVLDSKSTAFRRMPKSVVFGVNWQRRWANTVTAGPLSSYFSKVFMLMMKITPSYGSRIPEYVREDTLKVVQVWLKASI